MEHLANIGVFGYFCHVRPRIPLFSIITVFATLLCASCEDTQMRPPQGLREPAILSVSDNPEAFAATMTAELINADAITEGGFYIWNSSERQRLEGNLSDNSLSCRAEQLEPFTEYHYAAFISNGQTEILSDTCSFTTLKPALPTVRTISVSPSITEATLKIYFSDLSQITDCTVSWGKAGEDLNQSTKAAHNGDCFQCRLTGLEEETDYSYLVDYYTPYDLARTQPASFRTQPVPFSIEISSSAEPGVNSVKLIATITANKPIDECGFAIQDDSRSDVRQFRCELHESVIELEISDLRYNTAYTYSVYYKRNGQTLEGPTKSFNTLTVPMPSISDPDIIVETDNATLISNITDTEYLDKCGFILTDKNGEKQQAEVVPDNGRIVYTWDGLTPGTDYCFCAFCSNGYETSESTPIAFKTRSEPFDKGILNYLLGNFDTDKDGRMSKNELESITEIILSDILLESQSGLESMPNLISLSMGDNWLKRIDLSVCPKLEFFSGGRSKHLEELYIDNPRLWQLYIFETYNLKTIDTSRCPELSSCYLWLANIEHLDFSSNERLETLGVSYSNLTELDLSRNWKLKALFAADNNDQLQTVWLKEGIIMNSCEVGPNTEIKYK